MPGDRKIGLIGGLTYHSTLEYLKGINDRVSAARGGLNSAEIAMHQFNFAEVQPFQQQGNWRMIAKLLADETMKLGTIGAKKFVLATNTWHKVVPKVEDWLDVEFLHIAEPVATAAKAAGVSDILLLGTQYTMEDGFYAEKLAEFGVESHTPSAQDRQRIDGIIFHELGEGKVEPNSVEWFYDFLRDHDGDTAALACTELPMLIDPQREPPPVRLLDTTQLHIAAAADYFLGRELGQEPEFVNTIEPLH